jgi:hypothetical protein
VIVSRYSEATFALEEAFIQSIPTGKKKLPTKADWAVALEKFNGEARSIRVRYRLGMIGRALVAYRLQRRLIANGHPPDVVRQLLFSMILNAFVG